MTLEEIQELKIKQSELHHFLRDKLDFFKELYPDKFYTGRGVYNIYCDLSSMEVCYKYDDEFYDPCESSFPIDYLYKSEEELKSIFNAEIEEIQRKEDEKKQKAQIAAEERERKQYEELKAKFEKHLGL